MQAAFCFPIVQFQYQQSESSVSLMQPPNPRPRPVVLSPCPSTHTCTSTAGRGGAPTRPWGALSSRQLFDLPLASNLLFFVLCLSCVSNLAVFHSGPHLLPPTCPTSFWGPQAALLWGPGVGGMGGQLYASPPPQLLLREPKLFQAQAPCCLLRPDLCPAPNPSPRLECGHPPSGTPLLVKTSPSKA